MRALLLALLFLLGCATTTPPLTPHGTKCMRVSEVYISTTLTGRERELVARAAGAWMQATPECFALTADRETADLRVEKVYYRLGLAPVYPGWASAAGLYLAATHTIYLVSENYSDDQKATILGHEFGHYLGLDHAHLGTGESIVNPVLDQDYQLVADGKIPQADVEAYWRLPRVP